MLNRLNVVTVGIFGLALASCATQTRDDSERIAVTQANALGVTSIGVDRFEEPGANVVELRGFDRDEAEIASARVRIGQIDDLESYLPGQHVGTDIRTTVQGKDTRIVTDETEHVELVPPKHAATQQFLALTAVSAALLRDANIEVAASVDPGDRAGADEVALTTWACVAGQMNVTPVAKQCCFGHVVANLSKVQTTHVNPAGNFVRRLRGNNGACKTQGGGACSGAACYFGPNGFGRPQIEVVTGGYAGVFTETNWNIDDTTWTSCGGDIWTSPPTHEFADVTGTFPNGQGCPGGSSGGGGQWDYP